MGLFDFLFGSQNEQPTKKVIKNPIEKDFKSADWVIREAFNEVMASITISKDKKDSLFNDFKVAHDSGDPREEQKAITNHLLGTGWRWEEYEKWAAYFKNKQQWPCMWEDNNRVLTQTVQAAPQNMSEAIWYFTVNELKEFLKGNNIKIKPAPKNRSELELKFTEAVKWEAFRPVVIEKHNDYLYHFKDETDKALCRLLAHTISMTIYRVRNYHSGMDIIKDGLEKNYRWEVKSMDNIEDEFARKFTKGEIKQFPPFFPRDRCSFLLTWDDNF